MRKFLPNSPGIPRQNRKHLRFTAALTTRTRMERTPNHLKRVLWGIVQLNVPKAQLPSDPRPRGSMFIKLRV